MELNFHNLTLIDLISEKHARLRKILENRWEVYSDIHFSHAEWHLLSKINQQSLTISQAASLVGISRQAMQKTVKKLAKNGFLHATFKKGNKRDKFLVLTELGNKCCEENEALKRKLELDLKVQLGENNVENLKMLFQKEWLPKF